MQALVMDSSQLTTWCGCSREWSYVNGENLIAIADPTATGKPSEAAAAGTLGHKYLEIYYTELAITKDREKASEVAMSFDPDKADLAEQNFPLDKELRQRVRNRFVDYLMTYTDRDITPATKKIPTIIIGEDGNLRDSFAATPLVEQGFSYKLFESKEYLFVLEGRIDLIGRTKDLTMVWEDHKFQFREKQLYKKSIQFRNYSLVTKLNIAVINYIRMHEKVGPRTFVREPISFSSQEMHQWQQELTEIYVTIARQVAKAEFPMNRGACGKAWGGSCQFAPLCETYDPNLRELLKKQQYGQRRVWRPW